MVHHQGDYNVITFGSSCRCTAAAAGKLQHGHVTHVRSCRLTHFTGRLRTALPVTRSAGHSCRPGRRCRPAAAAQTPRALNRRGAVCLKLTLTLSCGGAPYSPTPSPNGSRRRWAARRRSQMPPCRSTGTRPPARRPAPTASGAGRAPACAARSHALRQPARTRRRGGTHRGPPVPAQDAAMHGQPLTGALCRYGTGKAPQPEVCAARVAASHSVGRSTTPAPLRTSPSQQAGTLPHA